MPKLYRLYVDESGDHNYRPSPNPEFRYLALLGVIIDNDSYSNSVHPDLEALKQKHFQYDPDDPVILHRTEIINCKGAFWVLRDEQKRADFDRDLLAFLAIQDYLLILVVIDKSAHLLRYGRQRAYHPYHYCLDALLERYCGYLRYVNGKGDVMAEARGGSENRELQQAYERLYSRGTDWRKQDFFSEVLTSNKLKIKPKVFNIAGLQIADLMAHPCKQEFLAQNAGIDWSETPFVEAMCKTASTKYNRRASDNRIQGYGQVFLSHPK